MSTLVQFIFYLFFLFIYDIQWSYVQLRGKVTDLLESMCKKKKQVVKRHKVKYKMLLHFLKLLFLDATFFFLSNLHFILCATLYTVSYMLCVHIFVMFK